MSGAEKSKLEELADQAALLDGPPGDGAPGGDAGAAAPAVPLINGETQDERNTRAIGFALAMIREATASPLVLTPPLRTLADKMPDEVVQKIAGPWGRVATHYGFDLMAGIDHPAIEAILLTGPILWGIAAALARELHDRSQPKRRAGSAQDPESGG